MLSQELTLKSNDKGRYQWIIGMFGMLLHSNPFIETSYYTKDFSTPTSYKNLQRVMLSIIRVLIIYGGGYRQLLVYALIMSMRK